MDVDGVVRVVEELVARPFTEEPAHTGDWLEGLPQSGAEAHFAPLAVSPSLYETAADDDGTIGDLWWEAYRGFEERRHDVGAALASRWGPSQPYSFHAEHERVLAGDEEVSSLHYDLAMFTGGDEFPAWRRDGRLVGLLLGQMDKEFPIVLTVAVLAAEAAGG
ncbi:hypothetical protein [Cryptosporangium japonicum]|uniref:hypothetical protein n=1 Tax=Cryptosporangium japonicum TaxID=80872 RepID=UPI0031D035D7